jgi:hypothetical protein
MMRRGIVGALLVLSLGCSKKEPPPPSLPPTPSATATAADRLLPGELAEGRERALGLVVPRDMKLLRVFDDSAVARGRVGADAVSNYVRKRVDAATAEIGAARTVFPKAHVKGQPPERVVRIEVVEDFGSTELLLRDLTPPPIQPGLSEDERWRKAGVVPGKPFDPNAL